MAERKAFLLRIDPELYEALSRWAADELRSLNGQIEYLLRQATVQSGRAARLPASGRSPASSNAVCTSGVNRSGPAPPGFHGISVRSTIRCT